MRTMQLPEGYTVWSALQTLVKEYSGPGSTRADAKIAAILTELKHDAVVGPIAAIAFEYWTGCASAGESGHDRLFDHRIRQFDRAIEGIQEIVFADPVFFGGPKEVQCTT